MAAQFGRRLRRGAATTAVAAVAMAALTASQAPELLRGGDRERAAGSQPSTDTPIDGGSDDYYTDLPPLRTPGEPGTSVDLPGADEAGIPATVLAAYKRAEAALGSSNPSCNLPWELLAAIGKVESGQARGGRVDADGTTLQPILGPQLNGNGFANISDTDGGRYDGDTTHDRAVGPMQFIPSTWATWGADGNSDGKKDPNNVYDAALAAGRYLCADGRDLAVKADLDRAILGYNHSQEYLRTVLSWFEYYKKGTHQVPDGTGVLPSGSGPGSGNDASSDGSGGSGSKKQGGSKEHPGREGSGGSGGGEPKPRPTVSEDGTIQTPGGGGSQSPGDPDDPSGSPSPTPTECPTGSASPSPSESDSGSPAPSGSPSPSPTDDPCTDEDEGATPEPSPSSTGSAVAEGAAGISS